MKKHYFDWHPAVRHAATFGRPCPAVATVRRLVALCVASKAIK
jgi:hypothetical protein